MDKHCSVTGCRAVNIIVLPAQICLDDKATLKWTVVWHWRAENGFLNVQELLQAHFGTDSTLRMCLGFLAPPAAVQAVRSGPPPAEVSHYGIPGNHTRLNVC